MISGIPKVYFETVFSLATPPEIRPPQFAIITAYLDYADEHAAAKNTAADAELERLMRDYAFGRSCSCLVHGLQAQSLARIRAFSPTVSHEEPSWLMGMSLEAACRIGHGFDQIAIFYVIGDGLYVTRCEAPTLVSVASFNSRCPQGVAWR